MMLKRCILILFVGESSTHSSNILFCSMMSQSVYVVCIAFHEQQTPFVSLKLEIERHIFFNLA